MKIPRPQSHAAFTMVEIAICLAVIAFALVAIIGVLPEGMKVQRQNREETIINQDAAVFASAIRNGARGMDDLTNYVYAITNYWGVWGTNANLLTSGSDGYVFTNSDVHSITPPPFLPLTNGSRIVGLMSRPKYDQYRLSVDQFRSNHIVAFVRALSGPASEKPPQTNSEVRLDAFAYRMICETMPIAAYDGSLPHGRQLTNNLSELRLTFRWPISPRGVRDSDRRQTFRTQVGGHLLATNDVGHPLYFFQPQTFAQLPP
jgi:type II secretory pathway pseudopilin PulG